MRFRPGDREMSYDLSQVEADFARARDLGKVRLGEEHLFLPRFSGTLFYPYGQIVHAWLRQEEVNARLCCGTANFDQFYLMLELADGSLQRGQVLDKAAGKEALALLAARRPAISIGYYPQAPDRP